MLGRVWNSLNTLIGLTVAKFGGTTFYQRQNGVREFVAVPDGLYHKWFTKRGFGAVTLGEVIVYKNERQFRLRPHEMEHVRQCRRLGPLFLPAYGIASLISWIQTGDAYTFNWFEIQARKAEID